MPYSKEERKIYNKQYRSRNREDYNFYMREYKRKSKVDTQEQEKERAIAILKMFQDRIEQGLVKVETADWWSTGDIVTLRVDVKYLSDS